MLAIGVTPSSLNGCTLTVRSVEAPPVISYMMASSFSPTVRMSLEVSVTPAPMGTFFATPWVSGSPIIHSDAAVPPATVGISTCTPSDASCTSHASCRDRDPWHAAETSYSNCVVPWALADRQCGALFLPPFECATLAPLLERWCHLSSSEQGCFGVLPHQLR